MRPDTAASLGSTISVTIKSDENGRPNRVWVTDNDGLVHRFVRSEACAERALRAARDGRAIGFEEGVESVERENPPNPASGGAV